jgi:hypothetical protein
MGMIEQNRAPTVVRASGGSWPFGAPTGYSQYFDYWFSEVYISDQDEEIESGVASTAVTRGNNPITPTAQTYVITLPATAINSSATHFRLYRSAGGTDNSYDNSLFPDGIAIADIPITGLSVTYSDGGQQTGSVGVCGAVNTTGSTDTWSGATTGNLGAIDGANATVTATPGSENILYTYTYSGFGTVSNPITGIGVTIRLSRSVDSGNTAVYVRLRQYANTSTYTDATGGPYNLGSWSQYIQVPITGTAMTTYTLGGASTLWYPYTTAYYGPWDATSFNTNGKLAVAVVILTNSSSSSVNYTVDYLAVTPYFNGGAATGNPFPFVQMSIGGVTTSISENGPVPVATTGDVFEDSLVLNDTANPSMIRYSIPTKPESFPSIYFIDFESDDNDQVKCIRTLGNRLIVGTENRIWRVNYLPNEEDAAFNRGRAVDIADNYNGIVGIHAATQFVGADGRVELAYLSKGGLRATDGFSTRSLCDDINWRSILTPASLLAKCVLVNDPINFELILFYPGGDSTYLIKALRFNYHESHLKNGNKLKASGPFAYGTASTDGVRASVMVPTTAVTGYSHVLYVGFHSGAVTRQIDAGSAGGSTVENMVVKTRRMYLNGFAGEWKCEQIYVLAGGTQTITETGEVHRRGQAATTLTPKTMNLIDGLARVDHNQRCDALAETLTGTIAAAAAGSYRWDAVVVVGEDFEQEDA